MRPDTDLKRRVLAVAAGDASRTRPMMLLYARILVAVAASIAATVFLALGGVHAGQRPLTLIVGTAMAWSCVAVAMTGLNFGWRSMQGPPGAWLLNAAIGAPVLLLASTLLSDVHFLAALQPFSEGRSSTLLDIAQTLATGGPPLLAYAFARKGTELFHPMERGSALGAMAGVWAGLPVTLRCPYAGLSHVAVGHLLPVVVLIALGGWVGHQLLASEGWRRTSANRSSP
jgi:hypothetical protein